MRDNDLRPFKAMALMSAILSQLVGAILLGVFAGRWFDRLLETEPLFLIIGLLLGLTVGIYAMLRLIQHFFSGE
ncbi:MULTISPECIES: AtpZ/AtpI family protein [Cytobacillus]|uniref:AtpZ/AtpI family protein n=1 Tax=Cytobacillus stercorigallinarum TaxID=2762240 RepID=A0ABR8QTA8_9BACI|nr:AtpZ/AtpI family protein [Cytobacillus stercorigallinarum]MBD7938723.1 AtpZ/AtpI family protein [Cytobacillus stercorigallinarum]